MIRFILKQRRFNQQNGIDREDFFTIDLEVPELEKVLFASGGYGPDASDSTTLIGVELLPTESKG